MTKKLVTVEDQRADVVRRMAGPGARRAELVAELAELDEVIRPLIAEAIELGITTRRIGELVAMSNNSVARWGRILNDK